MAPTRSIRISFSRAAIARPMHASLLSNVIIWFMSPASCTRIGARAAMKPLFLVMIISCDHNHRVWREGSAMDTAEAERFSLWPGARVFIPICRRFAANWSCLTSVRDVLWAGVLGVGSRGHRTAPSIWRGSRLKWFEPEVPGARTSARRGLVESTAEAVARNLIHTTAGHKGRSAPSMSGATNEPAAAA